MKAHYGVYNTTTGQIFSVHTTNGDINAHPVVVDQAVIELPERKLGKYFVDISVNPHVATEKVAMSLILTKTSVVADATDEGLIEGVPNPSTVTWPNGAVTQETDGDIRFTLDLVGTFQIKIESLEYITEVVDVSATPAT